MRKIIFSILKKFLKVTAILVLSILVLIMACFLIMALHPDEKPIDDSDFSYNALEVPGKENGMIPYLNALNSLYEDENISKWGNAVTKLYYGHDYSGGDVALRRDPPVERLSKLKKQYDSKFGKVEAIIWSYDTFVWPKECDFSKGKTPDYCYGQNVLRPMEISRFMIIQAWNDLKNNREKEALKRLQFSLKLSSLLQSSRHLITYHLGQAIHTMCLSEINAMIDNNQITPDMLPVILKLLKEHPVAVKDLKGGLVDEYNFYNGLFATEKNARESVCGISSDGELFGALIGLPCKIVPSKLFVQKNATKNGLFHVLSFIINEAESSKLDLTTYKDTAPESVYHYNPKFVSCHSFLLDDLPFLKAMGLLLNGNSVGEDVVWKMWFYFRTIKWKYLSAEAKHNALLYKTAIKIYENDNGKLPENGSVLIPKYLDRIPEDPFSRKPLNYSAKRKMIYSVGFDLKDNDGLSKKEFIDFDHKVLVKEKDLVLYLE